MKKNDKAIQQVVEDYFRQNQKIAKGYVLNRIKVWWKKTMGPTISSYTKNIYIQKDTLVIQISSAPLRHELNMSKAKLLKRLQESLDLPAITKVDIK